TRSQEQRKLSKACQPPTLISQATECESHHVRGRVVSRERKGEPTMDCASQKEEPAHRLNEKTQRGSRDREPCFLSFSLASAFPWATAWAFAPRISARNGWAAAGGR